MKKCVSVKYALGISDTCMFLNLYKQVTGTTGGISDCRSKKGYDAGTIGGSATNNYVFVVGVE